MIDVSKLPDIFPKSGKSIIRGVVRVANSTGMLFV
jgi:hypothetical protein